MARAVSGVSAAGLSTTVHPAASAGAILRVAGMVKTERRRRPSGKAVDATSAAGVSAIGHSLARTLAALPTPLHTNKVDVSSKTKGIAGQNLPASLIEPSVTMSW